MRNSNKNSKECIICKGLSFNKIVNSKNLKVYECTKCGLCKVPQKKITLPVSEYFRDYDLAKYVSYYEGFRKKIYKQNWADIKKWKKEGSALDFGSSFGWFLEVAPKNWKVYGVEPADVVNDCKKKGLKVVQGTELDVEKLKTNFDVVTMWNVAEHLSNPIKTLKILDKKMNKGSIFAIAVPNRNGFYNQLSYLIYRLSFGKFALPLEVLFQADNPVPHLFHYRIEDMEKILELVGYKVIKVDYQKVIDAQGLWKREELQKGIIRSIGRFILIPLIIVVDYILDLINLNRDEFVVYARKKN